MEKGTTGTFNNENKVLHDFIESSLTTQSEKKFGKHPTQKPIDVLNHFTKVLSNEGRKEFEMTFRYLAGEPLDWVAIRDGKEHYSG